MAVVGGAQSHEERDSKLDGDAISVWARFSRGYWSAIAQTPDTKVQGVLIAKMCSYKAETRVVPGGLLAGGIITIYPHTKECALMPDCQKSGYGIFTYDQKFLLSMAQATRRH